MTLLVLGRTSDVFVFLKPPGEHCYKRANAFS